MALPLTPDAAAQTVAAAQAAAAADLERFKALVGAGGVVVAAMVAAIVGTLGAAKITANLQKKRNEQDRESQWRSHAIELTKLDADRLMKRAPEGQPVRPFILTFLANYRDLQELGRRTPAELYQKIQADRVIQPPTPPPAAPPPADAAQPGKPKRKTEPKAKPKTTAGANRKRRG